MLHRHVINVGVLAASLAAGLFAYQIDHQNSVPVASRHVQSLDSSLVADVGQDRTDAWTAVQRGSVPAQAASNPISAQTIKSGPGTSTSSGPPPPAGSIQQIITSAFSPQGQPAVDWALRIAKCESGYNPRAYNPSSGTMGLFQFKPGTWAGTPEGNQDPYDPVANSNAAAWLYAKSGPGPWQCR